VQAPTEVRLCVGPNDRCSDPLIFQPGTYTPTWQQFANVQAPGVYKWFYGVPVVVAPPVVRQPPPPAKCTPWPIDLSSTRPFAKKNKDADIGFAVRWYCKGKYGWAVEGFSGRASELVEGWEDFQVAALFSRAKFNELWTEYLTDASQSDPALRLLARAIDLERMPADPVYVVAPNSTSPTRPTYPVVDGIRKTTSNGRANVGAKCDCKRLAIDAAKPYCAVDTIPGATVALCQAQ
jgi:hypothetical protein